MLLAACDEDRSFTIDQVNIDAVIEENGTIRVQEQFTYTFDGSFEGVTRSILSDESNFQAFAIDEIKESLTKDDFQNKLKTEYDDDTYKVYQGATDETKSVLYTYDIKHSVEKYADIGLLKYHFFDSNNDTDIHHLTIRIATETPGNIEEMYAFLQEDGNGTVTLEDGTLVYENELLPAKTNSLLTYLFPTEQIPEMLKSENKEMLAEQLAGQADWEKRGKELNDKMAQFKPFLYILIAVIIVITTLAIWMHPNRTRKYIDDESLQALLEKTDPTFIHYLNTFLTINDGAIIPALFSLKMRKVVRMEEVSSEKNANEKTIRFTWLQSNTTIDDADKQLKEWLFTEETNGMPSFLLENITDDETESDKERTKKGKKFDKQFKYWKDKVEERPEYDRVRYSFSLYTWISVLFIAITAGSFYYFISIDQITVKEQFWLQITLGIIALIAILCARLKYVTIVYYTVIIVLSFIFFTLNSTTITSIVLFALTAICSLSISAHIWTDEVGQIKRAMSKAYHEMFTGKYPLAKSTEMVENQILYAIVLDVGEKFAKQLDKEDFVTQLARENSFSFEPSQFVAMHAISSPTFYSATAMSSSSSSSSSSSTGGGGAGAF